MNFFRDDRNNISTKRIDNEENCRSSHNCSFSTRKNRRHQNGTRKTSQDRSTRRAGISLAAAVSFALLFAALATIFIIVATPHAGSILR